MSLLDEARELHDYYVGNDNAKPDIIWDGLSFTIYNKEGDVHRKYFPTPTASRFFQDDTFVRHLHGCYGSAKSTAAMVEIVRRACLMPTCNDGIRRARAVLVRNSMPDLKASTIKTWDYWFDELGSLKKHRDSPYWYEYRFCDDKGIVELEVYFLSGDEQPKKLDKFLSTEFTIAYLNEASALPKTLLERLMGRVGRYPSKNTCNDEFFYGVIMDTNPPKERHWLYNLFEIEKPEKFKIFKTPPGLIRDPENKDKYIVNINADNIENLPPDYYLNMTLTGTEEYIKVAALGEYGQIREGQPVYDSYNDDLHSIDDIEIDLYHPVYLGFDYGLTPCCMLAQFINGQLRLIQEFVTPFGTSVEELAESRLLPFMKEKFRDVGISHSNVEIIAVGDPSDPLGSAVKISPSMVLHRLGIPVIDAPTNVILNRIDAVKYFLGKLIGGKPALIISKRGCPITREGFITEYRYRKINTVAGEKLEEKPDKSHPYSDIHDATQYISLICHGEYHIKDYQEKESDLMRQSSSIWGR